MGLKDHVGLFTGPVRETMARLRLATYVDTNQTLVVVDPWRGTCHAYLTRDTETIVGLRPEPVLEYGHIQPDGNFIPMPPVLIQALETGYQSGVDLLRQTTNMTPEEIAVYLGTSIPHQTDKVNYIEGNIEIKKPKRGYVFKPPWTICTKINTAETTVDTKDGPPVILRMQVNATSDSHGPQQHDIFGNKPDFFTTFCFAPEGTAELVARKQGPQTARKAIEEIAQAVAGDILNTKTLGDALGNYDAVRAMARTAFMDRLYKNGFGGLVVVRDITYKGVIIDPETQKRMNQLATDMAERASMGTDWINVQLAQTYADGRATTVVIRDSIPEQPNGRDEPALRLSPDDIASIATVVASLLGQRLDGLSAQPN